MATQTGTQVPNAAPFPPLQVDTFASQILWFALTFGFLYIVMAKVALPRLKETIDNRVERIAADLATAQKLKAETDAAIAAHEKALADARAKGQALAAETKAKANAEAAKQQTAIEEELSAKMAAAEASIATAKAAAMNNVKSIAVEAAAAIVERLAGQAPAAADVTKAVDAAIKN